VRERFFRSDPLRVYVHTMLELGRVSSARRDDTRIFRLTGEFDLSNAWKVEDALVDAICHEQRDIVVDLTKVRFMDAQLVRALVKARNLAVRREVAFVVVPPSEPGVGRVAELVDFDLAA
jgi:anti-anti-sigma factor